MGSPPPRTPLGTVEAVGLALRAAEHGQRLVEVRHAGDRRGHRRRSGGAGHDRRERPQRRALLRARAGRVRSSPPRSAATATPSAIAASATPAAATSDGRARRRPRAAAPPRPRAARRLATRRGSQLRLEGAEEVVHSGFASILLPQAGEAARDALADDRLRRARGERDLVVLALVDHARLERLALVGRQRVERGVQRRGRRLGGGERVDALERLVGRARAGPSRAAGGRGPRPRRARRACASWRRAMPYSHADRRPALGPEAVRAGERRGERLGAQVGGQLGVARAAHEVAEQRRDVAPVELGERLRLLVERRQQRLVAALDHPQVPGRSHTAS